VALRTLAGYVDCVGGAAVVARRALFVDYGAVEPTEERASCNGAPATRLSVNGGEYGSSYGTYAFTGCSTWMFLPSYFVAFRRSSR